MRPNRVNPLTDESSPSSPVSQGSREARGRLSRYGGGERGAGGSGQEGADDGEDAASGLAELLRRTFDVVVFACVRCGGRRVLAYVKGAGGVQALLEHLGLPTACARLAPARATPGRVVLRLKTAKRHRFLPRT